MTTIQEFRSIAMNFYNCTATVDSHGRLIIHYDHHFDESIRVIYTDKKIGYQVTETKSLESKTTGKDFKTPDDIVAFLKNWAPAYLPDF